MPAAYKTHRKCSRCKCRAWWLPVLCLFLGSRLCADDVRVTSMLDLQAAIDKASPGDKIIVADGVYRQQKLNRYHEEMEPKLQPIEISAETIGGVEIKGSNGFAFGSPAAYIVLRGFRFTHDAGTVQLPAGTHHCRVTRNVFELKVSRRCRLHDGFGRRPRD